MVKGAGADFSKMRLRWRRCLRNCQLTIAQTGSVSKIINVCSSFALKNFRVVPKQKMLRMKNYGTRVFSFWKIRQKFFYPSSGGGVRKNFSTEKIFCLFFREYHDGVIEKFLTGCPKKCPSIKCFWRSLQKSVSALYICYNYYFVSKPLSLSNIVENFEPQIRNGI